MNAGREQRRGGTAGHVWSSRGAEQGVARCTYAGLWLDSNLFVTLPQAFLTGLAHLYNLVSPPYTFFLLNGDIELNRNRQLFV